MVAILLMDVLHARPSRLLSGCISSYVLIAFQSQVKVISSSSTHIPSICSTQQNEGFFPTLPRIDLTSRKSRGPLSNLIACVWLCLQNSMILSAAIFITLLGLLGYLHFVKIDQETLLIIGSLGIQLTSSYASGKESTTFIEMGKVKDVVINEAIYMVSINRPFWRR